MPDSGGLSTTDARKSKLYRLIWHCLLIDGNIMPFSASSPCLSPLACVPESYCTTHVQLSVNVVVSMSSTRHHSKPNHCMERDLSKPDKAVPHAHLFPSSFIPCHLVGLVCQAAAAFTFVAAAGYISAMAVCGLIAILVTGAVVAFCVLATVFICTTLITLIITGVPVGYALFQV